MMAIKNEVNLIRSLWVVRPRWRCDKPLQEPLLSFGCLFCHSLLLQLYRNHYYHFVFFLSLFTSSAPLSLCAGWKLWVRLYPADFFLQMRTRTNKIRNLILSLIMALTIILAHLWSQPGCIVRVRRRGNCGTQILGLPPKGVAWRLDLCRLVHFGVCNQHYRFLHSCNVSSWSSPPLSSPS